MNRDKPGSEDILQKISENVPAGKRVVFVSGNFNVVHPGHLRLLNFAASCGDFLVVGVNEASDDENVVIPADLRLDGVRAIGMVNLAFLLTEAPEKFIEKLKPAVVVKGNEHEDRQNPEKAAVESYGGVLMFSSGDVRFSSLDLLKREFRETDLSTIVKPADFPKRHGFGLNDVLATLKKFSGARVTVIGDLIVDEYIACDPLGMSQEDPTIVVTPVLSEKFVGGAGIVAAHAKGLGADVNFITVTGRDATAQFASEKLSQYGVKSSFFEDENRPTTLKQRFRANGKTLLRVSHLRQTDVNRDIQKKILSTVRKAVAQSDLLIFSDFNYGSLPQSLVESIERICSENGVRMVADSQSSSQVGDVSRFKGTLLMTPTEREARLAMRDFNSGLVILAEALRKKSEANNVVVTLGSEGLLIHAAATSGRQKKWITDRLPAFNSAPKDSAGAGDSFLISSSLALISGADIWQSAYLGSVAAACQVGRIGNTPLTLKDIEAELAV